MPKPFAEIIVHVGGLRVGRHVLEPGEYFIGRDEDCEIRVDSPEVSHHHARLLLKPDEARFDDLGSSNGSFIDGQRVKDSIRLKLPQQIKLGTVILEINPLLEASESLSAADSPADAPKITRQETLKKARNYRLGSLIARGGMGAVLDAQDLNIRRTVAMKKMLAGKPASRESELRFIQEATYLP